MSGRSRGLLAHPFERGSYLCGRGVHMWQIKGARGAWFIRPFHASTDREWLPTVYRTLPEAGRAALIMAGIFPKE